MKKISIPQITFEEAKEKHNSFGRLDKFLAHEHICRNRFVKNVLYLRQHGICPCCDKPIILQSSQIHHLSYDYYCQHLSSKNPEIKILDPGSNGRFFSHTPNCELCYFTPSHSDYSEHCLSNLVLLCSRCHNDIHGNHLI